MLSHHSVVLLQARQDTGAVNQTQKTAAVPCDPFAYGVSPRYVLDGRMSGTLSRRISCFDHRRKRTSPTVSRIR
eukprot:scaffold6052_cov118-Cylindrotheca_fusiformis.AAC.26